MSIENNTTYQALLRDGIAAQGDLLVVHISKMGSYSLDGFEVVTSQKGEHIVAHSETGHHHVLVGMGAGNLPVLMRNMKDSDPEMRGVIKIDDGAVAKIEHRREAFTHGELILPSGTWVICRQGRPTPEGWAKVVD